MFSTNRVGSRASPSPLCRIHSPIPSPTSVTFLPTHPPPSAKVSPCCPRPNPTLPMIQRHSISIPPHPSSATQKQKKSIAEKRLDPPTLPMEIVRRDWRKQAVGWFVLFWVGLFWVGLGEMGRGCCCSSLPNVSTTTSFLDCHSTRKPFERIIESSFDYYKNLPLSPTEAK